MRLYIYVQTVGGDVVTTPLLHKPTAEALVQKQGGEIRTYEIGNSAIEAAIGNDRTERAKKAAEQARKVAGAKPGDEISTLIEDFFGGLISKKGP
jgi:hypothetical protein